MQWGFNRVDIWCWLNDHRTSCGTSTQIFMKDLNLENLWRAIYRIRHELSYYFYAFFDETNATERSKVSFWQTFFLYFTSLSQCSTTEYVPQPYVTENSLSMKQLIRDFLSRLDMSNLQDVLTNAKELQYIVLVTRFEGDKKKWTAPFLVKNACLLAKTCYQWL